MKYIPGEKSSSLVTKVAQFDCLEFLELNVAILEHHIVLWPVFT